MDRTPHRCATSVPGGDLPPLVLVHGFTDHALYFTRVAEALAGSWDVVAYDARGHGASDRVTGRFGDATRVADLVAVVRELGLDRPALLGHSMGGATVGQAIAQYPRVEPGRGPRRSRMVRTDRRGDQRATRTPHQVLRRLAVLGRRHAADATLGCAGAAHG